jgi:hypothetical protein
MSRPGGPYRDERYPPRQPQYPPQGQPQYPPQGYPKRGYPDQGQGHGPGQGYQPAPGYGPDPGFDPDEDFDTTPSRNRGGGYTPYDEPGYDDRGYGQRGYDDRGYDQRGYDDRGYDQRPPSSHRAQERPSAPEREYEGGKVRIPGLGLVLSLLGLIVQVVSLTVLPWVTAGGDAAALPKIWDLVHDFGTGGFSGTYVLLFSYPLAVLGVLLSLVAVIQSVATKVIWAILAIIGLLVLVGRYGGGPLGSMISGDKSLEFSHKEIVLAIIALVALVIVIFMLRMAMTTFRIVGGLILLACAGVHVAALNDMSGGDGLAGFQIGAYGPALGYVLAALAAFIGPRKIA